MAAIFRCAPHWDRLTRDFICISQAAEAARREGYIQPVTCWPVRPGHS
jgi:hypothetical protein